MAADAEPTRPPDAREADRSGRRRRRAQVGIRDVAAAAGVSTTLVSFALNDRPGVAPASKERILAVARDLGYLAHPGARSMRTGRADISALVMRNVSNPFFLDVIRGAQSRAFEVGETILAVDSDYSADRERAQIERLAAARVDALGIAPVGIGDSIRLWQRLRPGTPVVVLNAVTRGLTDVLHVSPDNRTAVELATRHLAEHGHRRIAFLTAPAHLMADHDRLEAFLELASPLGLEPVPVETPLTLTGVRRAVSDLLTAPNPPSAVITNSDHTAHAVYKAARDHGVQVGGDLSVVGHDDLPTSELLDPPLTTLRLDRQSLGTALSVRLRDRAAGDHVEPVRLVRRASTGPP